MSLLEALIIFWRKKGALVFMPLMHSSIVAGAKGGDLLLLSFCFCFPWSLKNTKGMSMRLVGIRRPTKPIKMCRRTGDDKKSSVKRSESDI